ncbi:MAG TPA: hypothetical protein VGE79_13180, partial [Niastella sp.]
INRNPYDWLGHGMYFWENNYERALQWAIDKQRRGAIKEPAVIGALLQPGYCCDFLDSKFIRMLAANYKIMEEEYKNLEMALPRNKDLPHDRYKDMILRELDCLTIEFMHERMLRDVQTEMQAKGFSNNDVFDSTRGAFIEGGPIYEGAGIYEKTHIQICIRNLNCIKGFFLPRKETDFLHYAIVNEPGWPLEFQLWQ